MRKRFVYLVWADLAPDHIELKAAFSNKKAANAYRYVQELGAVLGVLRIQQQRVYVKVEEVQ